MGRLLKGWTGRSNLLLKFFCPGRVDGVLAGAIDAVDAETVVPSNAVDALLGVTQVCNKE